MNGQVEDFMKSKIDWVLTKSDPYMFQAFFEKKALKLRLNDFPDEPLCTIIVDNVETDIHEFPDKWTLPKHRENI